MKSSYIPSLDGLRACAFLMVFLAHAGLDKILPGGLGVTVFFFLSGYLITTLLRSEYENSGGISLKNFYIRRSLRILPPMYITLGVAYLMQLTGISKEPGTLLGLLSSVFYFFNYADLISHNRASLPPGLGVLWSLMIEEHFYLLFPAIYVTFLRLKLSRKRQAVILAMICLAALIWRGYLVFYVGTPLLTLPRWTYSATDARFDSILWGCILAIGSNPRTNDEARWLDRYKGQFAAGGLVLLLVSLVWREPHWRESLRYTLQGLALYPIFYYCISESAKFQVRWLEWRPLRVIGWLSFSMYLVHYAILLGLRQWFPGHLVAIACVAFGLSVLYGLAMRRYVESPLRAIRPNSRRAEKFAGAAEVLQV